MNHLLVELQTTYLTFAKLYLPYLKVHQTLTPVVGELTSSGITLNGLGTRIDLVSYMALRPKASPSNMDGPIFLVFRHQKKPRVHQAHI